jgi:hypothetical protein
MAHIPMITQHRALKVAKKSDIILIFHFQNGEKPKHQKNTNENNHVVIYSHRKHHVFGFCTSGTIIS